jgi:hypothetical protein
MGKRSAQKIFSSSYYGARDLLKRFFQNLPKDPPPGNDSPE